MEIEKNLKGKDLRRIFEFLNQKADKVSIERYCDEKIPEEEFKKVQSEYKRHIKDQDAKRREDYNKNPVYRQRLRKLNIRDEHDANKYFDELLEQDMDIADCLENDGEDRIVTEIQQDVLEKRYTRVTQTTQGPLMQQYYLKIGELLRQIEEGTKSLFEFPYNINGEEYENLTFYREGKPIFCICSHEKYATVHLKDTDKRDFKKIGVDFGDDEQEI